MIGIVSYYPNDTKIRNIRKKNHIKQLKFLVKVFPQETINIVSQNYNENDFTKYERINYINYKKPIGVAEARNILLKKFYESNEECLFLMDDDVFWYNYYDIDSLIKDFYFNSKKYDFDLLAPLCPNNEPFKKNLYNDNLTKYFTLKKINLNICPNIMLLKKVNIYQKTLKKDNEDAINEDKQFLEEFMLNGYKGYKVLNWVKKSLDINVCSIIETTDKNKSIEWHKKLVNNFENYINKKYNFKNGTKEFNKKYNKAEKKILVKRIRPYFIQSEVIPKK